MKYPVPEERHESESVDLAAIATAMRTLWHAMVRGMSQSPAIQGLQKQQFWVLQALADGPRRMTDLAGCAQTSQASLTGIVDRLEEHGLVSRGRSEDDRRVVVVGATDEGLRVLREANDAFLRRLEELAEPLTEQERKELLRLLQKLTPAPRDHRAC